MNKNALDCYFEKESLVRTKQEGKDLIKIVAQMIWPFEAAVAMTGTSEKDN